MTYRPPAIRVALDLADALYDAALELTVTTFQYGAADTAANQAAYNTRRDAIDVARTKLREHLGRMARSEQVAS